MSVATEIARLQTAKADIKQSIENKGVTVPSSENISNYSSYIDSIVQGVPELDVGGKNPVLVKEYHNEIPFSETNYPNITPSTNRQTFYKNKVLFEENVNANNFDYVVDYKAYIDFVYKQDVPYSSSYMIRKMYTKITDLYMLNDKNNIYILNEVSDIFSREFAIAHKSNTEAIQTNAVDGIGISNTFPTFTSDKRKIRVNNNDLTMQIRPNNMTADAFELIDTEKTKIVLDVKLYQVDKYTTPAGIERKKLTDWVLGE